MLQARSGYQKYLAHGLPAFERAVGLRYILKRHFSIDPDSKPIAAMQPKHFPGSTQQFSTSCDIVSE